MSKRVLVIIGTRPEAIKLIPLYDALKNALFDVILCATNQHTNLLEQACTIFNVTPDINLNIMQENQNLLDITKNILEKITTVYNNLKPDLIIVQGDTTTAFTAALAAFYQKIPIAHVEAGLRSGDKYAPYPEEINRKFITQLATYHFAPTALNVANLLHEDIARDKIFCTGNTIVDALYLIKNKIETGQLKVDEQIKKIIEAAQNKKIMLLTAHRRESFGDGLLRVFKTIKRFALEHPDVFIFYPLHPNPNILTALDRSGLSELKNIYISQAVAYTELVYLLISADWVVTDSGGIQEEAVSLGKPVLVLRDVSERAECFWEGFGKLVGTNEDLIMLGLVEFYEKIEKKGHPPCAHSKIFGDGNAVKQIVVILKSMLKC